jgi:hypothetical protein
MGIMGINFFNQLVIKVKLVQEEYTLNQENIKKLILEPLTAMEHKGIDRDLRLILWHVSTAELAFWGYTPFWIHFPLDTTHELHLTLEDNAGNRIAQIEFLNKEKPTIVFNAPYKEIIKQDLNLL